MGTSIYTNGSNITFDCGGGGFFNLRKNIALAWDKEFGEHYSTLAHCWSKAEYDAFDKRANEILDNERFKEEDVDVLDFLFQTDEEGSISHKTCKKIYDLIKDIDFGGKIFTYAIHSDGKDYERFKVFLLDCYKHRRKMRWC